MAERTKAVFYKSSGEALMEGATAPDHSWGPAGVRSHADKLARAYTQRERHGIRGLVTVSGAGNIVRGNKLMDQGLARGKEDFLGRLATIQNTFIIASALEQRGIPHAVMLAPNMALSDVAVGEVPSYSHEAILEAFEEERIVLIGGGKGTDGNTTDAAIMYYAAGFSREEPDSEVVVLKGTKVDGVYDGDPVRNQSARRYAQISAGRMLSQQLTVVDAESLRIASESGINMIVYNDAAHDISHVLDPSAGIGTVVHGAEVPSQYADEIS